MSQKQQANVRNLTRMVNHLMVEIKAAGWYGFTARSTEQACHRVEQWSQTPAKQRKQA